MITELERLIASMIATPVYIGKAPTTATMPYVCIWGTPSTDSYPTTDGSVVLQCWVLTTKSAADSIADTLEDTFNCTVISGETHEYHLTKSLRSYDDNDELGGAKLAELTLDFRAYKKGT